jgi:hypothetical protein
MALNGEARNNVIGASSFHLAIATQERHLAQRVAALQNRP